MNAVEQAIADSRNPPARDYSTVQWNYTADGKPEISEGQEFVFVLMSKRSKKDGTLSVWSGRFWRKKRNFQALAGHVIFGVYAWAYLPEPASYIEPET